MITLTGHRSIITGAGAGIGRGTALSMTAAGASVALLDIDSANLEETVSHIRQAGGDAVAISHHRQSRWFEEGP
jgi:NAD(P)-dependent dehydrogenase (short-subunit alcohol dehydrogenase family)